MTNKLNEIQTKVLEMCANGLSVSETAAAMGLSEHAIVIALRSAAEALNARSISHAAAVFTRLNGES